MHPQPCREPRLREQVLDLLLEEELKPPDRDGLLAHLESCAACRQERSVLEDLLGELALASPTADPPPGLREKLSERIRAMQPEKETLPSPGNARTWTSWEPDASDVRPTWSPAGEAVWEPTGVAGVSVRRLSVDRASDRVTMLIRMEANASYPAHVHGGAEECYVIEGDIRHGDRVMRAGDFERTPGGSRHGEQSTEEGCLLLVTSSLEDEFVG